MSAPRPPFRRVVAAALLALCGAAPVDDVGTGDFLETVVRIGIQDGSRLKLTDMDGDGRADLVRIGINGVGVSFLADDDTYATEPDWSISWPSTKSAWDIADIDGDGADDVVVLDSGARVLVFRPVSGSDEAEVWLADAGGFLPRGIRRMRFVRDVDGDGRRDVIIPGSGRFLIHRGTEGGLDPQPLSVVYEAEIELKVGDPESLDGRFGQEIGIPLFSIEDVDGDGRTDLLAESKQELAVYLAGDTLPSEPSWTLDLEALRAEVDSPESIDLEDLFANVTPQLNWQIDDVDGVAPHDLILQRGNRFTVHLGGTHGLDPARADQVLKASGNVLHFVMRDVDGDGLVDLQLLRAETISLGTVLRWLVIAGSLDFDVYTYRNEGGRFVRKPTSRKRISLRLPALIGLVTDKDREEWEDYGDEITDKLSWPATLLDFDGDGRVDDVIDQRGDELVVLRDRRPADFAPDLVQRAKVEGIDGLIESFIFGIVDDVEDGAAFDMELLDLPNRVPTPGWDLHLLTKNDVPVARQPLPSAVDGVDWLRVVDLNGDGYSDIVAVCDADNWSGTVVQILIRKNPNAGASGGAQGTDR